MTSQPKSIVTSAVSDEKLALILEQMTARIQTGEVLDADRIISEYPEFADRLRQLLPAMLLLADASQLDGSPVIVTGDLGEPTTGTLGDFRLIREVGRGGMGVVYEAEQISLRRRVALKVLPWAAAMDPKQLQRFKNEALAAASLKHDHIVSVYAVGCERGVHYYAMEFIEGQTLAQLIGSSRERKLPENATGDYPPGADAPGSPNGDTAPVAALSTERTAPRGREFYRHAAELIADAADALEHAHSLGIVHRDIKPGNFLLDANGRIYVSDFGLARFGPDAGLTMSGDLLGTLRYMAPEQALARHGLADHRVDVYGLGCTLYELLTGRPTVEGQDKADIVRRIAFEEPIGLRKVDKAIPAELETITLKCLAKNPNERYATAGELADDLRHWLEHKPIKAKPPGLRERAAKWGRRHVAVVWATSAVLLFLTVAATVSSVLVFREQRRTRNAYAEARQALDKLSSQVIDEWLAKQPQLTKEHRAFLEDALASYERFAAMSGTDMETRAGVASALLRVGDIRQRLGEIAQAEMAYTRSIELYERLADAAGATAQYRPALARAYQSRGAVLKRSGRNAESETSFKQAMPLQAAMMADAPSDPAPRSDLAGTLFDYGDLLKQTRRSNEAERSYRRGIDLMRDASADATVSPAWRHRLAQLHIHLGSVVYHMGQEADAEKCHRQGIELLDELVKSAGSGYSGIQYREDLANGLTELGHVLGSLRRPDEAADADRRAVEIRERIASDFPAVPEYRHSVAKSLQGMANHLCDLDRLPDAEPHYSRATSILEKLMAEFPGEVGYRETLENNFNYQAYSYGRAGRTVEAEALCRQALERDPEFAFVRFHLGKALADQGKWEEAIAAFREFIRLKPDNYAAHHNLGLALGQQGKWEEAIAADREAIRLKPDNYVAHHNLGLDLANQRKWEEAIACFREAIRLKPDCARAHCDLGVAYEKIGEWDKAFSSCREAIRLAPDDGRFHSELGVVFAEKGQLDQAIACFREAIGLKPDCAEAHDNLGIVCRMTGKWDEAVSSFREAIRLDKDRAKFHLALGGALEGSGQSEQAVAAQREAIRLEPNNPGVQNDFAWLLANCRNPRFRNTAESVVLAKKAVEMQPTNGAFQNTLGVANYRAGDWKAAVAALEKSMQLTNLGYGENSFFLAMAHWQLGDKQKARTSYDQGVQWMDKNKPKDEDLRRFRAEATELLNVKSGGDNPK